MQVLIVLILSFSIMSFYFGLIVEVYSEDLVIDEKVNITISKNNETLIVPAKIGIEHNLWRDKSLDFYSVDPNHTSPLTTNNYNGTINIKSIHEREFTLENFLDIWGFDKSKIKYIYCNLPRENCNLNLTLTNGQSLKLEIKNEDPYNFRKYVHNKITFDYPSKWNIINNLNVTSEYTLRNESLLNLIKVFPTEAEYMTTPLFLIQINKLDTNNTKIDEYYKNNLYRLLQANENTFPHFINYTQIAINGNQAYQIFLDTTLIAEPGSSSKGNNITQKEFHIWTIEDGIFYDIAFKAFENIYDNYYSMVDKIIKSIQFQ
jgi:hypothetical protein